MMNAKRHIIRAGTVLLAILLLNLLIELVGGKSKAELIDSNMTYAETFGSVIVLDREQDIATEYWRTLILNRYWKIDEFHVEKPVVFTARRNLFDKYSCEIRLDAQGDMVKLHDVRVSFLWPVLIFEIAMICVLAFLLRHIRQ